MGYKITATAIVTRNQALLSIEAGADCVAVYVGRADNISGDGIKVVEEIGKVMKMKGIDNVILAAASMRTAHQVEQAALAGADNVAVSLDILKACSKPSPHQQQCRRICEGLGNSLWRGQADI